MKSSDQSSKFPPRVRDVAGFHINRLQEIAERLDNVIACRGKGFILSLELRDQLSAIETSTRKISDIAGMAKVNGIDMNEVIDQFGTIPDFAQYGNPAPWPEVPIIFKQSGLYEWTTAFRICDDVRAQSKQLVCGLCVNALAAVDPVKQSGHHLCECCGFPFGRIEAAENALRLLSKICKVVARQEMLSQEEFKLTVIANCRGNDPDHAKDNALELITYAVTSLDDRKSLCCDMCKKPWLRYVESAASSLGYFEIHVDMLSRGATLTEAMESVQQMFSHSFCEDSLKLCAVIARTDPLPLHL